MNAAPRRDEGSRSRALLEFDAVSKRFSKRLDVIERFARRLGASVSEHTVHAVDRVTFAVDEREVVGLVGESGCGKSTLARLVARLIEPSAGEILFDGQDIRPLKGRALARLRRRFQMVFQDP